MKYIKKFENNKTPKIGDYAICIEDDRNRIIGQYINNNIGKIVHIKIVDGEDDVNYKYVYTIKYQNIKSDMLSYFFLENEDDNKKTVRYYYYDEILAFSKNKKELEIILSTNKYNL